MTNAVVTVRIGNGLKPRDLAEVVYTDTQRTGIIDFVQEGAAAGSDSEEDEGGLYLHTTAELPKAELT